MQFYEQFTMWRSLKRASKKEYKTSTWEDFYSREINTILSSNSEISKNERAYSNSLIMEKSWFAEGCPYYKLWPGVFDQFISTRLDIDTQYLKAPHKSFSIYFPDIEESILNFTASDGTFFVNSILIEHWDVKQINEARTNNRMIHTMEDTFSHPIFNSLSIKDSKKDTGMIKVRIDFKPKKCNEVYLSDAEYNPELKEMIKKINPPSMFFRNIPILPEKTIEECIGDFIDTPSKDEPNSIVPAAVIEACFRVLVGIYFVSTGSQKVLEYDVISKHLNAYRKMREGGDKKAKQYEEKAKNKGKYGWNVGPERKDRHLILPKGVTYEEALREAGSRELLYRHTRGGHWHLYWIGMNRTKPIIKWVEETIVKPDLPIRPIRR
ncbi:MAG: hypothetical protein J7L15_07260 [Clostridiales bacterium]|nr:hypothetical protein [Clostridiales bacterium]